MSIKKEEKSTCLLRQAARAHGFSLDELGRRALIPHTTFFRRLRRPEMLTVGNLRAIYDVLALDEDEALLITAALLKEGGENDG